jgi:CTD small phosphatase-like protein 2
LGKLGRDLSRTIIIDNIPNNFRAQPNNGLAIKTWTDEIKDCQLFDLLQILKRKASILFLEIHVCNLKDVRPVISKIKDEVAKRQRKGENNIYSGVDVNKLI